MTNKEKSELQKEVVASVGPEDFGRLLLAPRAGKTKIGIDIIKRDKPKTILWVTPSAKLAEEDIPNEFDTWKAKRYKARLITSTWMSLNRVVGKFDLIILDEEQFATENNMETLLNGELTGRIITLTGTPTKHQDKIDIYRQLNLKVLYKISINSAVDMGLLSNYSMKVIEVNLSKDKDIEAGNAKVKFMTSEEKQYAYLDGITMQAIYQRRKDVAFRIMERMRFVKNSSSKFKVAKWLMNNLEGRKLIFAPTIARAEELCDNFYHSKSDGEAYRKFSSGEIDEIAMVNSGGIGHTYKEIDHLILVQADSDKNGLTSQKIARTLLAQKDYKATIWLINLIGTQDEKWIESTLQNFDKSKVEFVRFKNLEFGTDMASPSALDMFKKNGVDEIQMGSKIYKL